MDVLIFFFFFFCYYHHLLTLTYDSTTRDSKKKKNTSPAQVEDAQYCLPSTETQVSNTAAEQNCKLGLVNVPPTYIHLYFISTLPWTGLFRAVGLLEPNPAVSGRRWGGGVTPRHPHSHSHPIHSSQLAWCVRQNPRTPKENILNPAQEGTGSEAQTHNLLDGGDPPTFWMKIPAFRGRFSRCNQSSVWKFKLLTIMEFVIAPVRRVWSVS